MKRAVMGAVLVLSLFSAVPALASQGGPGNDVIYGTAGDDVLTGGGGNDTIYSGRGVDIVRGGPGNDVCWVQKADEVHGCETVVGLVDDDA